jgi:hypothetical protein
MQKTGTSRRKDDVLRVLECMLACMAAMHIARGFSNCFENKHCLMCCRATRYITHNGASNDEMQPVSPPEDSVLPACSVALTAVATPSMEQRLQAVEAELVIARPYIKRMQARAAFIEKTKHIIWGTMLPWPLCWDGCACHLRLELRWPSFRC